MLEVRTTVWPDSPAVAGLPGIADTIAATIIDSTHAASATPALTWAIQKARPDGVSPDATAASTFRADRPGWAQEFEALVDAARHQLRDSLRHRISDHIGDVSVPVIGR